MRFILIFIAAFCMDSACTKSSNEEPFVDVPVEIVIQPTIDEISGMVQAGNDSLLLYLIEDSGNPPSLHLLSSGNGTILKSFYLKNVVNRDWEEVSRFNGRILIAETGDNSLQYPSYRFYSLQENSLISDTVNAVETYHFKYPDGPHDTEGIIADSVTNTIYLITKRDNPSRIYSLTGPFTNGDTLLAKYEGQLPITNVTGAGLSFNGHEIVVKNYVEMYWAARTGNESLRETLKRLKKINYLVEPQGEAVTIGKGDQGLFTISELANASNVKLRYYKRR